MSTTRGVVTRLHFKTAQEKADYLDAQASLDARLPAVRAFAGRIARTHDPNRQDLIARDLHTWVRDNVRYVPDPGDEEFADTETILSRAFDDCDGKARAFVALCRAVGVDARIRPVFHDTDFTHVQAECRWPGCENDPLCQKNGWMYAELIVKDLPLGADVNSVPRLPDGRRQLT